MLTKSGTDMPRKQNDDWIALMPAADAAPVTLGAVAATSADLLAVNKTIT